MIDYGMKEKVAIITGANNPQGIGATTALALAREGAKVVLVYKQLPRPFDPTKSDRTGVDRYFAAKAGNADLFVYICMFFLWQSFHSAQIFLTV